MVLWVGAQMEKNTVFWMNIDPIAFEAFLNSLDGDIISIVPNIIPKFHMMGATAGYDFLLIIEKIN